MSNESCKQCEEHAKLHSGNWLGIVREDPCPQCEAHVKLHGNEGCGGLFIMALVTCGAVVTAVQAVVKKR